MSRTFPNLLATLFSALICVGTAFAQTQVILPTGRSEVDTLRGRVHNFRLPGVNQAIGDVRVAFANGRLTIQPVLVTVTAADSGSPAELERDFDFQIGRLPSGNYPVDVLAAGANTVVVSGSLQVKAHADPLRANVSGHYWNAAEPGWGMMLWHRAQDDAAFAVWFTYRDHKPHWMALSAETGMERDINSKALRRAPMTPIEMRGPPLAPVFDVSRVRVIARGFTFGGSPAYINMGDRELLAGLPGPLEGFLLRFGDLPQYFFGGFVTNMFFGERATQPLRAFPQ